MLRTAKPCGPGARGWRQALRRRNSPDRVRVSPSIRKATEARGIRLRGEHGISRKAIAQGRPGVLRWTCMLVCSIFCANRTRDRGCSAHPVFPAPSVFRAGSCWQTSGAMRRENANAYPRRPGQAKRDLRCAIAHRGTHNHREMFCERSLLPSLHREITRYGSRRSP